MSPSFSSPSISRLLIGLGFLLGTITMTMAQSQVPDTWDEACISYIPNAISPNGDGINDSFSVKTVCELAELKIFITDQAGQVIFEANSPSQNWDGTLNGKPLPEGYYNWEVSFIDPRTQQQVRYEGEFVLLP